jgi:hypothetical protein
MGVGVVQQRVFFPLDDVKAMVSGRNVASQLLKDIQVLQSALYRLWCKDQLYEAASLRSGMS